MEANDKVIQTVIKHSRLMDRGVRAGDPNDTCVSFVELFGVGLVLINSLEIFCLTRSHVSAGHNCCGLFTFGGINVYTLYPAMNMIYVHSFETL